MISYSISNPEIKSCHDNSEKNFMINTRFPHIFWQHWLHVNSSKIHDFFPSHFRIHHHHVKSREKSMESSSSIFLLILVQVVGILAKTENGREIIYSVVSGTAHLPCNITPPQGNLFTMVENCLKSLILPTTLKYLNFHA